MNREIRTLVLAFTGITLLLGAAFWYQSYKQEHRILPYYKVEMYSDEFVPGDRPPSRKVSDFNFINQNGDPVNQKTIGDCIYVADFIYTTCPGICKIMTNQMGRIYKEFKQEPSFKILSHTSKPEEDSIAVLKTYALRKGADNPAKWLFLTGNKKDLQRMAFQEYGIVNPEDLEPEGSFVHTEMFVLVDKNKYIRGYYDGTDSLEVNQLIDDIRCLLKE